LPQSPRYAGDTITVPIDFFTGANVLTSWQVSVAYNPAVLAYVPSATAPLYNTPSESASSGLVSVAVTGIKASTAPASVTGTIASAVSFTFTVLADAPTGLTASVMTGTVGSMVNQGTITFVSNAALLFSDDRSGWAAAGELAVAPVSVVGL
jgi:hypothetical protein